MKRLLDIVSSAAALTVFLPAGLVITAILRCSGEGEIFYRQQRIGRGGKPFGLLKFATMLKNSPNMGTGTITVHDDPRVLPIGRILRKWKLNEVPQLLNVLKGDMSLVGPRPLTSQTFSYYPPEAQEVIATATPGLTGVGSIVFRDEEAILAASCKPAVDCYRDTIAPRKAALELWYIRNQSFRLDLWLIALTAYAVAFPRSKYPEQRLGAVVATEDARSSSAAPSPRAARHG